MEEERDVYKAAFHGLGPRWLAAIGISTVVAGVAGVIHHAKSKKDNEQPPEDTLDASDNL